MKIVDVRSSSYHDSLTLMRMARILEQRPGISRAAALMATPANLEVLVAAGFSVPTGNLRPTDLVLGIQGDGREAIADALRAVPDLLRPPSGIGLFPGHRPRTLAAALRDMPDANLAVISVPGPYARHEATNALVSGLNVFLFSDNVPLADEQFLKRLAVEKNLLCMGPDCGTAYIDGTGLGFYNDVPAGRVGCVAASGTGLQAIVVEVAGLGEGVSNAIGVGSRDWSQPVGALMTAVALERLGADAKTEVIVLVSKTLPEAAAEHIDALVANVPMPVVGCFFQPGVRLPSLAAQTTTAEDAARAAVAIVRGQVGEEPGLTRGTELDELVEVASHRLDRDRRLVGLFAGGSLAQEALTIIRGELGSARSNLDDVDSQSRHEVVDLGSDEFTRGRPHPMLDSGFRDELVARAVADASVGLVLVDIVLGHGVDPSPAVGIAQALSSGAAQRNVPDAAIVVASVIGTDSDPQSRRRQVESLKQGGVFVLPSSAQAAHFATRVMTRAMTGGAKPND